MDESSELRLLFHRLNNELGIILANAALLEAKASNDIHRARAAQVAASVIDAMETAREIHTPATTVTNSQARRRLASVGVRFSSPAALTRDAAPRAGLRSISGSTASFSVGQFVNAR
jgi:hypothetical protein